MRRQVRWGRVKKSEGHKSFVYRAVMSVVAEALRNEQIRTRRRYGLSRLRRLRARTRSVRRRNVMSMVSEALKIEETRVDEGRTVAGVVNSIETLEGGG